MFLPLLLEYHSSPEKKKEIVKLSPVLICLLRKSKGSGLFEQLGTILVSHFIKTLVTASCASTHFE